MGSYYHGLAAAVIISAIGIWMIYRAMIKDTSFLNETLRIPIWLAFTVGILLQLFFAIYIWLGVRAKAF